MSTFGAITKLCTIPLYEKTLLFAASQRATKSLHRIMTISKYHRTRSFVTAESIQNPLRAMDTLKREHIRIKSTMQSFERMLDIIQRESHSTNTVTKEHIDDLNGFIQFCRNYNLHHHNKEKLMFDVAKKKGNECETDKILLNEIEEDHKYGTALYRLMEKSSDQISEEDENDKINKLDDVMIPSKSFIHLLYDHMIEEDDEIYPKIVQKLTVAEMEDVSQKLDDLDHINGDVINAMEFLSDELMLKYK